VLPPGAEDPAVPDRPPELVVPPEAPDLPPEPLPTGDSLDEHAATVATKSVAAKKSRWVVM
jgi:hypothetical protein